MLISAFVWRGAVADWHNENRSTRFRISLKVAVNTSSGLSIGLQRDLKYAELMRTIILDTTTIITIINDIVTGCSAASQIYFNLWPICQSHDPYPSKISFGVFRK
jgi:hypothetical protein